MNRLAFLVAALATMVGISTAFVVPSTPSRSTALMAKKEDLELLKKADYVSLVADKAGVELKLAEQVVNAALDTIVESVADNKKLTFIGFGTFEPRTRSARKGRNPKTGESMDIAEKTLPAFSASKAFKDKVSSN
mmetsp:Transcript_19107/g.33215  ORF Transcript_19107/g.33215 Transcript_19107/m.33215 type:complete len:135 (-) Transcript_19107:475-879(-)